MNFFIFFMQDFDSTYETPQLTRSSNLFQIFCYPMLAIFCEVSPPFLALIWWEWHQTWSSADPRFDQMWIPESFSAYRRPKECLISTRRISAPWDFFYWLFFYWLETKQTLKLRIRKRLLKVCSALSASRYHIKWKTSGLSQKKKLFRHLFSWWLSAKRSGLYN